MIRTLRPSGVGALTQLSRVGDTANWKCVDESSSDGDTTYVVAVTAGDAQPLDIVDSYATQNLPTGLLGAIVKVRVHLVAKYHQISGGYARAAAGVRIGSTSYSVTIFTLSSSYASMQDEWVLSPATLSAWTIAEINGAQLTHSVSILDDGIGTPTEARATQLYMEVEHVRVFQPTAAASMAMGGPQAAFYHPGPPSAPPKLSAALQLRQSGSASAGLSTSAIFALKLSRVDTLDGDF